MIISNFSVLLRKARIELLKIHTKDSCMNMTDEDWETLGQKTELYSGSDIANLTLGALFQPIREMQNAKYWKHLPGLSYFISKIFISWTYISSLR